MHLSIVAHVVAVDLTMDQIGTVGVPAAAEQSDAEVVEVLQHKLGGEHTGRREPPQIHEIGLRHGRSRCFIAHCQSVVIKVSIAHATSIPEGGCPYIWPCGGSC